MKLQFKFREHIGEDKRAKFVQELYELGAKGVRPLFPEETDPELASLYVIDFGGAKTGHRLLKLLQASPVVEFAEEEVRRKLVW